MTPLAHFLLVPKSMFYVDDKVAVLTTEGAFLSIDRIIDIAKDHISLQKHGKFTTDGRSFSKCIKIIPATVEHFTEMRLRPMSHGS